MDQYRTYLKAELAKLRNIDDGRAFAGKAGPCLRTFGLAHDTRSWTVMFATQRLVNDYVEGLGSSALVDLTVCCGQWRENRIAEHLSPRQTVEWIQASVADVLLNEAERSLWGAFARLNSELTTIAQDPEVLGTPPYCLLQPGEQVAFPWCLATPEPGRPGVYRVFDGMHRAIQLFRNGEAHIPLCVVHDPALG